MRICVQVAGKERVAKAMESAVQSSPATLRSALFEALNVQKTMKRALRHVQVRHFLPVPRPYQRALSDPYLIHI